MNKILLHKTERRKNIKDRRKDNIHEATANSKNWMNLRSFSLSVCLSICFCILVKDDEEIVVDDDDDVVDAVSWIFQIMKKNLKNTINILQYLK